MKVGDLVKMRLGHSVAGTVIRIFKSEGLSCSTRWVQILWPDHGLGAEKVRDLVEVGELSDEQLEQVRGGMSRVTFSHWRATTINGINEDR